MQWLKRNANAILNVVGAVATAATAVVTGGLSVPSVLAGVAFVVGKLARTPIDHDSLQQDGGK